jgi:hypothetical protein
MCCSRTTPLQDESSRPSVLDIASYCHALAARPLLGMLAKDGDAVVWSSGGADLLDILGVSSGVQMRLSDILISLGVGDSFLTIAKSVQFFFRDGTSASTQMSFSGFGEKVFSLYLRRRNDDERPLQFTLSDSSEFSKAARGHRLMAKSILKTLDSGKNSPLELLSRIRRNFKSLEQAADEAAVTKIASKLASHVELIVAACIEILREFEQLEDYLPQNGEITAKDPVLFSWREIVNEVDGGNININEIRNAADFIRNAIPIFLLAPPGSGVILALNGTAGRSPHRDISSLVKSLKVGENSVRTASDFFSTLTERPSLATFAVDGVNMEARGRALSGGGWQAVLAPAMTHALDVRGFFHGFKNLLLHLQILYVLRTPKDVSETRGRLSDVLGRIDNRLTFLRQVSETGSVRIDTHRETVEQWLAEAEAVAQEYGKELTVNVDESIRVLTYVAIPEEMGDTFSELIRNAFQHGAVRVKIVAKTTPDCVIFYFADDGSGMTDEKLEQVRTVLSTKEYYHGLSTRKEGTGNGLLGAAIAVSRFVDGSLRVERSQKGSGTVYQVSLAFPSQPEAALSGR